MKTSILINKQSKLNAQLMYTLVLMITSQIEYYDSYYY